MIGFRYLKSSKMNDRNYVFTKRDQKQLESYIPIMECLGSMFGKYCEVVLHSFEDLNSSIIHIVNGHVTGREIGAPVTNIALRKISKFTEHDEKWDVYNTGTMINCPSGHKKENFTNDVNSLVLSHLNPIKLSVHSNNNIPSKNKVFAIVKRLYEEGMFNLPITIKLVSQELSISSATIYKHLRVIKDNPSTASNEI